MGNAALDAAISAAVKDAVDGNPAPDLKDEGTAPAAEATPDGTVAPPDSKESSTPVEPTGPAFDADEVAKFEARFGVDLSVLPDDATKAQFMAEALETNKTISKLQRENAELKKAADTPPPAAPAAPAPETVDVSKLSDEQIAQALGIEFSQADERDYREIASTRLLLEQADRLERLEQGVTTATVASEWERALDRLENQFGAMPEGQSRADLVAWANEQGVSNPEAAYWAAVGPIRTSVAQALNKQLVELKTASKKGATTPRPKTSAETAEKLQSKDVKSAIKEAFEKSQAELGITLPKWD